MHVVHVGHTASYLSDRLAVYSSAEAVALQSFGLVALRGCLRVSGTSATLCSMTADDPSVRQDALTMWPPERSKPVEAKGLVEAVIERMVELIEAGILKPGRKIPPEKQLMAAFRVGRSTLREALRSLVALHMLESHQGKGYFVSTLAPSMTVASSLGGILPDNSDLPEIMEARGKIEIALVELALERATREDMAELKDIAAELREAAAADGELLPYTMRVHLSIGRAARNGVLLQLFRSFIPWIMAKFELVRVPRDVDLEMHLRLIDGFMRRDRAACLQTVQQHQQFWTRQYYEHSRGE